jgi:hypothetical protein
VRGQTHQTQRELAMGQRSMFVCGEPGVACK